jgi:hypothetical protein
VAFYGEDNEEMGFHKRWITRIMLCISIVNYQVKGNQFLTEVITPQRGLRQGPLSPYIFILCVEGFSSLLNRVEEEGEIEGIKIYVKVPQDLTIYCLHATHLCLLKIHVRVPSPWKKYYNFMRCVHGKPSTMKT